MSTSPVLKSELPFEIKVTGTPVAMPMVYCTSRSASPLHRHHKLVITVYIQEGVDLPCIISVLSISAVIDSLKSKRRRRIDIRPELLQEVLENREKVVNKGF